MSDPQASGAEPSEEELQEYARRLRATPAEQVVTEVLSALLQAAQAKVGRRDGRLMVDLSALVLDHARRYLSSDLTTQVDQLLSQLRLAQVRAEEAVAAQPQAEPEDLAETPAPPATGTGAPPPSGGSEGSAPSSSAAPPPPPAQPSPVSRLWVPGRDF